jgi:hypothetical protein
MESKMKLITIMVLATFSLAAFASWNGPFENGSLVFRTSNESPISKGKIIRTSLNTRVVSVYTTNTSCFIYNKDFASASNLFLAINSNKLTSVVCEVEQVADLKASAINTESFSLELNKSF